MNIDKQTGSHQLYSFYCFELLQLKWIFKINLERFSLTPFIQLEMTAYIECHLWEFNWILSITDMKGFMLIRIFEILDKCLI